MTPDAIARYDLRVPRYTSYPTAPHFTPEVNAGTYAGWLSALPETTTVSLYVHIPFCAELCLYCGCHTTVARTYNPIASYVEYLLQEIALIKKQLSKRLNISHIHWGGGTPTIVLSDDMARIMQALADTFNFKDEAEIAIEIDPRTVTRDQVEALAKAGFNRASLGVQDFNPQVQKTINRIQSFEETQQVVTWLREFNISGINLDLMYGLPHQTVEGVISSVRKALELEPDRLALFGYAHVPWMKKHQNLIPESSLPGATDRVSQMQAAEETITKGGYVTVGIDHYAKPTDPMAVQQKEGKLHRNFQGYTTDTATALIGFGTSAIGFLPQGYVQNASSTVVYRDAIKEGNLATARGIAISQDDIQRRSIIERLMCDFEIDIDAFTKANGLPANSYDDELERLHPLVTDGIVVMDGRYIQVTAGARPLVRLVCAVFDRYFQSKQGQYSKAL
ncbi:oxygen-independent coproporphyrinogen III oxidase [Microvirga sp. W0021]|uniref:Coproporphyrinogen-III oxidase n=1 Tax=Hohaiivirga grylli TaxID=3133970 RepID=A0ABV0BKZ7_9HYPH